MTICYLKNVITSDILKFWMVVTLVDSLKIFIEKVFILAIIKIWQHFGNRKSVSQNK